MSTDWTGNQFGPHITGLEPVDDMLAHLRTWLPGTLGQLAADTGRNRSALKVKSYQRRTQFDKFPEEMLPLIIVASPGTSERPWKVNKTWHARYMIRVTAVASGATQDSTFDLPRLFGQAVLLSVMQEQKINNNPNVEGVDWAGVSNTDLPPGVGKSLSACQMVFYVQYANILDEGYGLTDPQQVDNTHQPTDPGPWPTVGEEGAFITIEREPIS